MEGFVEGEGEVPGVAASEVVGSYDYYYTVSLVDAELSADDVLRTAGFGVFRVEGCF